MQITEQELAKVNDHGICALYGMYLTHQAWLDDSVNPESAVYHVEVLDTLHEAFYLLGIDVNVVNELNTLQKAYCRQIYHDTIK